MQEEFLVNIFDMSGKQISQKVVTGMQKDNVVMDIRNLAAGTYLVQLQSQNDKVRTMRFVKAN
jgi:hypothetical protein